MSDYLSASELADLIGCKSNQRALMILWLEQNGWNYVVDRNGLPKVARAYRDRKLGIADGSANSKYADTPNLSAFRDKPPIYGRDGKPLATEPNRAAFEKKTPNRKKKL